MMRRVPFLYRSRGQLELPDWPDPAVDVAVAILNGEAKNAAITITHWSKDVPGNFMVVESDRVYLGTQLPRLAIGL